jgi:hypothetical protein
VSSIHIQGKTWASLLLHVQEKTKKEKDFKRQKTKMKSYRKYQIKFRSGKKKKKKEYLKMLDTGIGKFFTNEVGKMQQAQKPLFGTE